MTDRSKANPQEDALWPTGALLTWLGRGLQRLLGEVLVVAVAVVIVLVVAALIPDETVGEVEGALILGAFLAPLLGGLLTPKTLRRQMGRPLAITVFLYVVFAILSQASEGFGWLLVGLVMALWLITLLEFGLRGSGRSGLYGDTAVEGPVDLDASGLTWPARPREGWLALVSTYLALAMTALAALLEAFR